MAKVNVYLPDDLAEAAKAADLQFSPIFQDAVRDALDSDSMSASHLVRKVGRDLKSLARKLEEKR